MVEPATGTAAAKTAEPTIAEVAAKLDELLLLKRRESARFKPVDDAADYAGVSVESIRRLLSAGKLTALRPVRGRVVIDRNELDSLILSSDQRPRKGRGLR